MTKFERQLAAIINAQSLENDSNTPDHILASYLKQCLDSFNHAVNARELWHGKQTITFEPEAPE